MIIKSHSPPPATRSGPEGWERIHRRGPKPRVLLEFESATRPNSLPQIAQTPFSDAPHMTETWAAPAQVRRGTKDLGNLERSVLNEVFQSSLKRSGPPQPEPLGQQKSRKSGPGQPEAEND